MADVKWIRLSIDMFDNRKIKYLRSLPDGDSLILIWVMLLTVAGRCNAGGMIFLTENVPYTVNMLAKELDFEESTITLAINAFKSLGMVDYVSENLLITGWEEHQNADGLEKIKEQNRIRQKKFKEKQKLLLDNVTNNVADNKEVTLDNAIELELEIERDIDIEKDIKNKTKELANAQTYFPNDEKLNSTFLDFMNMRKSLKNGKMTERAITMMINKLNKYEVNTAIAMLEQSILNNWKDVYDPKQQSKQSTTSKNKFNQFPQREYTGQDYSSLEQALLNKR